MWRVVQSSSVKPPRWCVEEGCARLFSRAGASKEQWAVSAQSRDAEQPKAVDMSQTCVCALSRFLSKLSISSIMCLWLKGLASGNPVLGEIDFQK